LIGAGSQTSTQYIKIINPDSQSAQISFTALGVTSLTITNISPSTATKGQTVTFTLTGTGFQSGFTAKIINELSQEWDIPTKEYVSSTTVKVTVLIGAGSQTSTQYIKIINPDSQSAQISFTALGVTSLTITSISPSTVTKGQTVTFTLTGTGFQSGFTAKIINELSQEWDIPQKEYVSSTTVKVTVLIGAGSQTSTQYIKIINPDSQSAQISFTALGVTSLTITNISPSTATKGQTVTFTLTGTGFQAGFTAKLINELNQEFDITQKEFVSSMTVKVTVYLGSGPTSTQYIKIINPDNQSAQISFTALGNSPTLTIDGGTSSSKPRGGTYNFAGSNYTPNRTVTRYLRQPDGSTIVLTPTLSADGNGRISWSFTSLSTTPIGTYSVWVIDDNTGRTSNTVSEIVTGNISRVEKQ